MSQSTGVKVEDGCPFCGASSDYAGLVSDVASDPAVDTAIFVRCNRCGARGPEIDIHRPDANAQAVAAWGHGKKFGAVGVANVPAGMPAKTCALAERLRLIAEAIYRGDHGDADALILLLRNGKHVSVTTQNLSSAEVFQTLAEVTRQSHVREAIGINLPKRTETR